MGLHSMFIPVFSLVTFLLFQVSQSSTFVFDGVSHSKNHLLQIGDSVIFHHKYEYSLCIFKNKNAFTLCNFTQSTILTKPNSTSYTWRTSRTGFFYFAFKNGSGGACLEGQKLAAEVSSAPAASPDLPPPLTSGGTVASSPAFPWPFRPRESVSPSPSPGLSDTAAGPTAPDREGIPFITSNPAVPLPTGDVDSATLRPPISSGHQLSKQEVVGFYGVDRGLSCVMLLLMIMV